jgi:hypothetical protein
MRALESEKSKDKEAKAKNQAKDTKPAINTSSPAVNNDKEISRIKKAIGISEQNIEKLEKEIALIDDQARKYPITIRS